MQTVFGPNLFEYIMKNQRDLSFPQAPFFLYKILDDQKETDWDKSIYFNMSISEFNILNWGYNTGASETGIMLVESISNFKTYFSQIVFNSTFNINVDFTRMSCDKPIEQCPID